MQEQRGRRLIPSLVDEIAKHDPKRIFASFATTPDFKHGTRDISFHDLARAVNRCSWWLETELGQISSSETISYLGTPDLSLFVLMLAAIKTGHKLFLGAPTDSVETHVMLHHDLACQLLLTPADVPLKAQELLMKRSMRRLDYPDLHYWLAEGDVERYPFAKSIDDVKQDPFVVLTTSGSTGFPKPVVMTHGTMVHHDLFVALSSMGGGSVAMAHFADKRVFMGLAMFHSAAICFLVFGIYSGMQVVLAPPGPVTAAVANAAHIRGNVQVSFLAPHIITELSRTQEYLENLKRLEFLTFGGAALPRSVGTQVKQYVHLFVCFGATETGYYALEMTEPEDWAYIKPAARIGCVFKELGQGLHELYFVRDPQLEQHQGVFSTFSDLQEYATKDIYSKHPTKNGLWLYEGRSDDVIVLYNGFKINPLMFEGTINTHALVSAALMSGSGRSQTTLLIEPKPAISSDLDAHQLLAELWPHIEQANQQLSDVAKVGRRMIIFTSPLKPMVRAGKGTVRRKLTLDLYEAEIASRYAELG